MRPTNQAHLSTLTLTLSLLLITFHPFNTESSTQKNECQPLNQTYTLGSLVPANASSGTWTFLQFHLNATQSRLTYHIDLTFDAPSALRLHNRLAQHTNTPSQSKRKQTHPTAAAPKQQTRTNNATTPLWGGKWIVAFVSGLCIGSELGPNNNACPSDRRCSILTQTPPTGCAADSAAWCPSWTPVGQADPDPNSPLPPNWNATAVSLLPAPAQSGPLHSAPAGLWYVGLYVVASPKDAPPELRPQFSWAIHAESVSAAFHRHAFSAAVALVLPLASVIALLVF